MMKPYPYRFAAASMLAMIVGTASAATPLETLASAHYHADWAAAPVSATQLGVHDGDARLDDLSIAGLDAQSARLHREREALAGLLAHGLSPRERDEAQLLDGEIARQLLTNQRIQPQRHDPDLYASEVTNALYSLMERDYAPAADRMRSAIAREQAVPALLAMAEHQLSSVPSVFRDIALEDLSGGIGFVQTDVPAAFAGVQDAALKAGLAASTGKAVDALRRYQVFVTALKPTGSFVLGRDTMQAMLAADLVDLPVEKVVAAGRAQLARDRAAFLAAEKEVDAASPVQAMAVLRQDHPDASHLVGTAQDQLQGLRDFVVSHHIVTLPSDALPTVIPTPPFSRALITAAMDWPGALETSTRPGAQTAFYNVTPPDATMTASQSTQLLEDLNRPALLNITVHEAMPGHFVQSLYLHHSPDWSLIRRLANSYDTTEGWAHYSEAMMVEQGLENHDPKLHLAQLQDALLRDCRLVDAFGLHAQGMTLAQATDLMRTQCFQSEVSAAKEARRGTEDPGYYAYTLGKLMILHLRADRQQALGSSFSLQRFHDALLGAGLVPIRIIRREMTGRDAPLL